MADSPQLETLLWAAATVVFLVVGGILVAHLARWIAARAHLSENEQRKIYWGFLFASPWLIGFVIFVLGPSLASLYYSFTEYRLGEAPQLIGLENYRELVQAVGRDGRNFRAAMYNSLYYAVVGVPLQIGAALGMALLLNTAVRGLRTFRLIYYLPVVLAGGPAILLAWRYMLAANGGFVNEAANGIAGALPFLNTVYRSVIFAIEKANGFFLGIAKGDPSGPLNYFLPALLGLLLATVLLRGAWTPAKASIARGAAELIAGVLGTLLLIVGLMVEPVDLNWVFIFTLLALIAILSHARAGEYRRARWWQIGTLCVLGAATVLVLLTPADASETWSAAQPGYLLALAGCAAAILATLLPGWSRAKSNAVLVAAIALIAILAIRLIPGEFGGGRSDILVRYLTFSSAIEQPDSLDYLETVFPARYFDSAWLFGLVAAVALGAVWLHRRSPRVGRGLLVAAFVVFALLTTSSLLDSVRYFNAYETAAALDGTPVYHFARFREAGGEVWEGAAYNPKWLTSDLWSKPALILINMWSAGAGMLIFLAALKGVPTSLYEAAKVDGANRVQRFFSITLPTISPALFYNIVIGMIAALQTFETVYVLRTTETETSIMSAAFYLYRRTFEQANIGEGAAMSWLLAIIIVGLTVIQFRYSKWVNYEA